MSATENLPPFLAKYLPEDQFTMSVFVIILTFLVWVIMQKNKHPKAIDPQVFREFPLIQKDILSHDTRRFTFQLQTANHTLGLPVGMHVTLRFTDKDGKSHQRSYTPVTTNLEYGKVSFVIKVYRPNKKFPNGGKMSQHLDSLKLGECIQIMGPKGHLHWLGSGGFQVQLPKKEMKTRNVRYLSMMAGGTGITPMLQILHAIFSNTDVDKTKVKLLYANQTEDDILVREELEALAKKHPDRFQLHYTLDHPPANWKGSKGFITKEMIQEYLYDTPDPMTRSVQVFMCGPQPMIRMACLPALKELGFTEDDWHVF